VESLSARANVDDPRNPAGSLQLDLTKLTAAGFQFDTVRAQSERCAEVASPGAASERQPLALDLDCRVRAREEGGPDRCRAS
jgi:hypothetical protein